MTGHTGFKGGWLSLWLHQMGASVHGYSLEPPTEPNLFSAAGIERSMTSSVMGDIRDLESLERALKDAQPEIVFHLAAQPLVRHSYREPIETLSVNIMGTANLLDAVRRVSGIRTLVNITSDKCYQNREWVWPYRENEPMGGDDPYSSSKACSELITAAYRKSFLSDQNVQIATARAGNVIGGGDWATDRLVPDFFRALDADEILSIRYPNATRPWQHVLEPLSGYLLLAEKVTTHGEAYADAWNFGPQESDSRTVEWIAEYLCKRTDGAQWKTETQKQPDEARALRLDSSRALAALGWRPRWNLETALEYTIAWHQSWKRREDMDSVCRQQIQAYETTVPR